MAEATPATNPATNPEDLAADGPRTTPTTQTTTTTTARRGPAIAIEANAMVKTEMTPTTMFGADGALVFGARHFFLRLGAGVQASRAFVLGAGEVANTLQYGMLDGCAGKTVVNHRIRMCAGAEAGAWAHLWSGFEIGGRKYSPHVAGVLKADYRYAFTDRFGVLFGAGVSVPVVGPSLHGVDQYGRPTPVVIMGPVAGSLRLGASFRFR